MGKIRLMFNQHQQPKERKIRDMIAGEIGYTVPWAIDMDTNKLNDEFGILEKGGTASVRVFCVRPGVYDVSFETPVYRNPFKE